MGQYACACRQWLRGPGPDLRPCLFCDGAVLGCADRLPHLVCCSGLRRLLLTTLRVDVSAWSSAQLLGLHRCDREALVPAVLVALLHQKACHIDDLEKVRTSASELLVRPLP